MPLTRRPTDAPGDSQFGGIWALSVRYRWGSIIFIGLITVSAVIFCPIYLWQRGLTGPDVAFFAFYTLASAFSITLGYHRLFSHAAFKADRRLNFPLLADFHPKGEVARSYGVYRDQDGVTERALFVLNAEHDVAWSHVSPIGISPGVDGALRAVEALS